MTYYLTAKGKKKTNSQWNPNFKVMSESPYQPRILNVAKLYFKNNGYHFQINEISMICNEA